MPICAPCRPAHTAAQCDDVVHARTGTARRCSCQHKPRTLTAPIGQPTPGPECEIPTERADPGPSVGAPGHTGRTATDGGTL